MSPNRRRILIALPLLAVFPHLTFAKTPAVYAEDGVAVDGTDVVAYFTEGRPVAGKAAFSHDWNGATWWFSSAANRDAFAANPAKYLPEYDGHCAYGVSKGGKVPGNPNLWRIVDGKLYLNITENVVSFWEEDIPGNLDLAENNWVSIEAAPASDRAIPNFSSPAPVN